MALNIAFLELSKNNYDFMHELSVHLDEIIDYKIFPHMKIRKYQMNFVKVKYAFDHGKFLFINHEIVHMSNNLCVMVVDESVSTEMINAAHTEMSKYNFKKIIIININNSSFFKSSNSYWKNIYVTNSVNLDMYTFNFKFIKDQVGFNFKNS